MVFEHSRLTRLLRYSYIDTRDRCGVRKLIKKSLRNYFRGFFLVKPKVRSWTVKYSDFRHIFFPDVLACELHKGGRAARKSKRCSISCSIRSESSDLTSGLPVSQGVNKGQHERCGLKPSSGDTLRLNSDMRIPLTSTSFSRRNVYVIFNLIRCYTYKLT